jgi:putative ABC transport system permease protein
MSRAVLFTFLLARRFMRGRALARSTLVMVVSAAFLIGTFVAMRSLTLSGAQAAEQQLGHFGALVNNLSGFEGLKPGDGETARRLEAACRSAGIDVTVELYALDIRPTGLDPPRTYYSEAPWRLRPFPDRFLLSSGRWPARPDEVVVTNANVLRLEANSRLSVLSGRHEFRVVGTARDRYGRFPTILAAPGTWARLDPGLFEQFPALTAYPLVYSPSELVKPLVAALAEVLARRQDGQDEARLRDALLESTTTRKEIVDHPDRSWVERLPAGYSIPSLLLPFLATFLVFGLNDRRLRRNLAILSDLGVSRARAVTGLALAVTARTLIATVAGAALGLGLALAARPILQSFHPLPLSPVSRPGGPVLRLLAMTLVGGAASALALHGSPLAPLVGSRRRRNTRERVGRHWRDVRHILAVLIGCATVVQLSRLDSIAEAMVLTGTLALAALLIAPEAVSLALRAMTERAARSRLARRQLLGDRRRAVIATTMLAVALGLPLGFLTLIDTLVNTNEASTLPEVAPGQLALAGRGGTFDPPSPAVVTTVGAKLGPSHSAIPHRFLGSSDTFVYFQGTNIGFVLALDKPAQVAALLQRRLSSREAETLRRGGVLVWEKPAQPTQVLVKEVNDRVVASTSPVPVIAAVAPRVRWRDGTRGLLLSETARHLRLPLSTGALFYTGLSSKQVSGARLAVLEAGLDPKQVLVYKTPPPVIPPLAFIAAAAGLALLTLMTCLVVARSQVQALRGYLGTLIAIGLPIRWARQVLLIEQAVIFGVGTALAGFIAITPVALAVWRLPPKFVLTIPWLSLITVLGAVYLGSFLAVMIASRKLRPYALPTS